MRPSRNKLRPWRLSNEQRFSGGSDLLYLPNNCNGFRMWTLEIWRSFFLFAICPPVALCGLPQNHPVSSDSLLLFSGISQGIQLSTFLPRYRLIMYLSFAYDFSIYQPLISKNLYCVVVFPLEASMFDEVQYTKPRSRVTISARGLCHARTRKWAIAMVALSWNAGQPPAMQVHPYETGESENWFCAPLLNSLIQDHSDHGPSKDPTNPFSEWTLRFLWYTIILEILD